MPDLLQSAKLFEVGAKLQTASSCVGKFAQGLVLEEKDQNILKWAGGFLSRVDWTSEIDSEAGEVSGLTVSATNTRPKFYASLLKISPKFSKVGIDSEQEVYKFLKAVYSFLISGGTNVTSLTHDQLELVCELLHTLSQNIIVDLSNNMLPKRRSLLSIGESF